ncbi:GNAT family N-acetyltransferase [Oscillatoria salina]|uniref:GNAT family N-acetyltransferase n=1 Tax=Oscillatoria salina TaxID=331517 RepID=UPI0013BB6825|nr:GNAT family N-acetyltransferase [Oscillatoria salina]MBZ8179653.1 GNAT family N-acetyltransferase [Oscillatoria salina IIICB1]NET89250.1 GNAT family N-acetyltransferase [Kamptonema sp. SIO1D9]
MSNLEIRFVSYPEAEKPIRIIRTKVFQEEQKVDPKLEFDGKDESCQHLLAYFDGEAVGTARIRCINNFQAKIERLAVLPFARRKGVGKQLMEKALAILAENGYQVVEINAQIYVKDLYSKLGFTPVGEEFLEAGMPHLKMVKKLDN